MTAVLFDYDGTLHNAIVIYGEAFRRVYGQMVTDGKALPQTFSNARIAHWLGLTPQEMWEDFRPDLSEADRTVYSKAVGSAMVTLTLQGKARLYPRVPEALDALKNQGFTLVFLSNCPQNYMDAHRKAFGLNRWFDGFYCSESFDFAQKTVIYPHIRRDYGKDFIIVGDRDKDMAIASTFGLPAVGCLYGFGSREELSPAACLVETPQEMVEALVNLRRVM